MGYSISSAKPQQYRCNRWLLVVDWILARWYFSGVVATMLRCSLGRV